MEKSDYPIRPSLCCANTLKGGMCRQPALKNGRCHYHGGKSLSGKGMAATRKDDLPKKRKPLGANLQT